MDKKIIATALLFGMTAIILGAFGAHALKEKLTLTELATFETGVRYQMYHALFLLFVGVSHSISGKTKRLVFYFTVVGVLLFSGSIYLLSTQTLTGINFRPIGIITPIGGLSLIIGWTLLLIAFFRQKS